MNFMGSWRGTADSISLSDGSTSVAEFERQRDATIKSICAKPVGSKSSLMGCCERVRLQKTHLAMAAEEVLGISA